MQYLDIGSPDIALACCRAEHSLYFNPYPEVEECYVEAICADIDMDFTSTIDDDNGGGIEIFAVNGRHCPPWHFDAQQNFTVQLTGTKRWSVRKGPLRDPLTNLHLKSSNTTSVLDDTLTHRACGASIESLQPPMKLMQVMTATMKLHHSHCAQDRCFTYQQGLA